MSLQNVIAVDNGKVIGINEGILADSVTVTKIAGEKVSSMIERLESLIDYSKIKTTSTLDVATLIFHVIAKSYNYVYFARTNCSNGNFMVTEINLGQNEDFTQVIAKSSDNTISSVSYYEEDAPISMTLYY